MIREQINISENMDSKGIKIGDKIKLNPIGGRRSTFTLNRTNIDFISQDKEVSTNSLSRKILGAMNKESFHVQLRQEKTIGKSNSYKMRFFIIVLEGGPVRLNGNYIFHGYIEIGDFLEIGHNTLSFLPADRPEGTCELDKSLNKYSRVIKSELPILIQGDTGIGKTSLAKRIHENSGQLGRFVHLNICSFSSNLIESELFGHVKGAFTGAINDKKGAIKEAEGGTLFIDEMDSLTIDMQTKLLLFLDNGYYRQVGSGVSSKVKTRLVFSTSRPLDMLVEKKLMRKDFYFRVSSGEQIILSSLRDSPFKIINYCHEYALKSNVILSTALLDFYKSLPWPGNYRQLKGHLDKKLVLSNSKKLIFDKVDEVLIQESSCLEDIDTKAKADSLKKIKVAHARKIFYQSDCKYKVAAEKLEISTKSLRSLLKEVAM